jgi:V/A-type H+-transporting ATPase subunit I
MIIDVNKYVLIGVKEEIDAFFAGAQLAGIAEFISPHPKKASEYPLEIQHLLQSLKILRKLPKKSPYLGEGDLNLADEVAIRVISLKKEVERLFEEKRLVELESARVAPFGDFSLEDIDFIEREGKCALQFFCRKALKGHELAPSEGLLFVGCDHDLDYFVGFHKEPVQLEGFIEMRIDRPWGDLQVHLGFVKESLHQIEAELKGYAGHQGLLHEALLERLNDYYLAATKKELRFPLDNSLFVIEAWVPKNKTPALYALVDKMAIHCEQILIEEEDRVPTYMENRGSAQIGEDLVKIYDVPATQDKDPSGWVFWFFVLFFSMIVNDGGYGLLYLGICLYCKWKFPPKRSAGKRFLHLATVLSTGCVIWGVLTSAFFGLEINPKSWLGRCSLVHQIVVQKADYHLAKKDDVYKFWLEQFPALSKVQTGQEFLETAAAQKNGHMQFLAEETFADNFFLEFSLIVGMIHISLSLLRYVKRHLAGIGWVLFIGGAYLYFPSILKATSLINIFGIVDKQTATQIGLQVIYTGVITAMVFSLLQKRLKGIGEISTLIAVFADVLSYLRLYALGLSTAIMAETFNELGEMVGLFLGVLVILAGHSITILMGLMTGMIHGLRLNFIEWYHHSFVGGGRLFRPLMCFKTKERS